MANPTEAYPASADIDALNGTTDSATGLEFIALNTGPGSSPPLMERIDRRADRVNKLVAPLDLRVCKVDATHVGCYAGKYRLAGVDYSYAGESSVVANPSGNDTYYCYLTSTGALQVVTDATGWPADVTTYIPLAEVVVTGGAIASITDVRGRVVLATPSAAVGGNATDEVSYTLDADNGGAAADCEYRVNRGSTAGDAAIKVTGSTGAMTFLADRDATTAAPISALSVTLSQSDGTTPMTVTSTTLVANLNVDSVDGVDVAGGGALDPGGVAYASGAAELSTIAAGDAGDVLLSGGASAPTWTTPNTDEVVQAWDADLEALAGVSSAGLLARTGAGTAAARTLTAGTLISVTNGDGVSGNPTVGLAQGTSNTVVCGNTGTDSVYRQIVNDDISNSAAINGSKLGDASVSEAKLTASTITINNGVARGALVGGAVGWSPLFGDQTSYSASTNILPSNLNLICVDNTGASGLVTLTVLGTVCIAGTLLMLKVTDADGIKLVAPSACKIRDAATLGASGGYITSTTIGDVVVLQANADGSELWVVSKIGTWTTA